MHGCCAAIHLETARLDLGLFLSDHAGALGLPRDALNLFVDAGRDLLAQGLPLAVRKIALGRALLVLQQLGLIKVDAAAGLKPTVIDITENAKKLKFQELDAAQLPRSLKDLDAALINTNYAIASGLNPKTDAIAMESAENPYVNIIVVKKGNEDKPWVKTLIESYHSDDVKKFIEDKYHGTVLTSW